MKCLLILMIISFCNFINSDTSWTVAFLPATVHCYCTEWLMHWHINTILILHHPIKLLNCMSSRFQVSNPASCYISTLGCHNVHVCRHMAEDRWTFQFGFIIWICNHYKELGNAHFCVNLKPLLIVTASNLKGKEQVPLITLLESFANSQRKH